MNVYTVHVNAQSCVTNQAISMLPVVEVTFFPQIIETSPYSSRWRLESIGLVACGPLTIQN